MSINRNNRDYESEKDIVSSLRKQIFDLEQNEKNYAVLNSKFKNLQNDFNIISESKLKQEYDYKQRLESANKELFDLRGEIESIQQTLDERVSLNKKLFQDNSTLHKLAEDRAIELAELKHHINDIRGSNDGLMLAKQNLEKQNNQLSAELMNQKEFGNKVVEDNEKLSKMVEEQESAIRSLELDKRKLINKQDELGFENKSLSGKIAAREESLNQTIKKFDELNRNYSQLENRYSDLDTTLERTKIELSNTKKELSKEKSLRSDDERNIEKLEALVREKEKENRNSQVDIDAHKSQIGVLSEEKVRLASEIDKLKSHIMTLTEQNQILSEEIESYIAQDDKFRQQLAGRRDQTDYLLKSSKGNLDKSLKNLDEFFNKSARVSSPSRYSNTRQSKP